MRKLKTIALAASLVFSLAVTPTVQAKSNKTMPSSSTVREIKSAAPKKYSNCEALNAVYPGGVAKNRTLKNLKTVNGKKVNATSKKPHKVNSSLYAVNIKLDRDKDGIACEV